MVRAPNIRDTSAGGAAGIPVVARGVDRDERRPTTLDDQQEVDPVSLEANSKTSVEVEIEAASSTTTNAKVARTAKSRFASRLTLRNAMIGLLVGRAVAMAGFVHGLSQRAAEAAFLDELTQVGLRQPLHFRALTGDPILRNWSIDAPEARLKGIDFSADSLAVQRASRTSSGAVAAFAGQLKELTIDPSVTFARNRDSLSGLN